MRRLVAFAMTATIAVGCGVGSTGSSATPAASSSTAPGQASVVPPSTTPSAKLATSPSPAPSIAIVSGMFDVGGHQLYLRCQGAGSPTIVHLHGYSQDAVHAPASSSRARSLPDKLSGDHRFCAYDRANVGKSEAVPGLLTGATTIKDLHALLAAAKIEPPYVLLGASFPDELELDKLWPADDRVTHEEFKTTDEQLDQLAAYEQAQRFIGKEPKIPVTYMLATPSGWTGDTGDPVPAAYKAVVLDRLRAYVDRFSPGVVVSEKSPHWMENAVPFRIAEEVEKLISGISL